MTKETITETTARKELDYFEIGEAYGGSQEWFPELMMREGGCGAATACESCIYFARHCGNGGFYPYQADKIEKEDYINFAGIMKPYLHPRIRGIDTLELFMDGFQEYLKDQGEERLRMRPFHGDHTLEEARQVIRRQIDMDCVIPCLLLKHKDPKLDDYIWHWFMLTGYDDTRDTFWVKAVTFGEYQWLDLDNLWDTGYSEKGGLILYEIQEEK